MAEPQNGLLDRPLVRYSLPAVAVGVGLLLRLAILACIHGSLPTYVTFYPAVMLAAVLYGLRAGLLATALSALAAVYWVLPPTWSFRIESTADLVGLALFVGMGVFMSLVAEGSRRNRQKAAAYGSELALRESQRESEQRLRAILDSLPVAVFLSDPKGNVIFTNPAVQRIWGISEHVSRDRYGEYKGRWPKTGKPVEPEQWALARVLDTGQPFENDLVELEGPGGGRKTIHNFALPIGGDDGKLLGVTVVTEDVTERVKATELLRESEERFRLLFQQAAVGIKRMDLREQILEVNDKQCDILGYSRAELLRLCLADITHPEDLPRERAELQRLLAGEIASYVLEKRCRRKDGGLIWVRVTSSLPSGGDTAAQWWISVVEDITQRKEAEEALRRTAADLERSNRDLEQFAYVSSHDLQEPLRMVTGFMQLFEQRYSGKLDATADKYIHYAVDGATRMKRLIDDLLAYSRVGTKGRELEPVDSGEALRQALDNLRVSVEENQAHVTMGTLPTVRADGPQLVQLFQNLVGNGIKFRGDGPPKIHVEARRDGPDWVFSVSDNGIGIDPEFHDRVFVIFQRLHTKEKYPGTGIGLAICKKIVDRHGGRMWIESQAGRGSTFYFTLPA